MGWSLKRVLGAVATGGLSEAARGLKSPKMPTTDFASQLAADKENALFNFGLNNNKENLFGSQQVVDNGSGGWKTTTNYAAPIQSAIEGNLNMLPGMQQRTSDVLSRKAFDPTDPATRQQTIDALLSRMNFAGDEESLRTRLANQGLPEGSEAWGKEMSQFGQQKNDARMQAILGSSQEMYDLFNLDQAGRMAPINEMNAISGSAQSMAPDFGQTAYSQDLTNPASEQYKQALDAYNAKMAKQGQLTSGLFQLGGAAIAASDRRLKSNIVRVGTHPLGIGVYDYDIAGRRERGVMAQEVLEAKPEAVLTHPAGYLMVNYGML